MIVLLVMTDGRRDCIRQTLAAADAYLDGPITRRIIHDDSGDPEYVTWLQRRYTDGYTILATHQRKGFGGAIRSAWNALTTVPESFVFHLEDDFVIHRTVDLTAMMQVLRLNQQLVQLALRRQPWNDKERAAGGVVEQHPEEYADVSAGGNNWLEHRLFFTTNPSLYSRALTLHGWPEGDHSEGVFTHRLLENPSARFGYWGSRGSGEWCQHIGTERVGNGY